MPALKNFGITFLISAVVFSIVAYFAVGFLSSTVSGILDDENDRLDELFTEAPEDSMEDPGLPSDTVPEVEGDSFTVLFGITDKRDEAFDYFPDNDKAISKISTDDKKSVGLLTKDYRTVKVKSIVLMRVCKESGEYTFISVPSSSKVYTQMGAGNVLLEDVMFFYGQEYFVQKVAAMTGITPDYSVFVNVTELDDVLKQTGGFTCHISEDIYTDGKEYVPEPPEETTAEETTAPETEPSKDDKDKKPAESEEEEIVLEKAVSAGNVTVGASNIEAIVLYEHYADGVKERSEVLCNVARGFVGRLSLMDDAAMTNVLKNLTKNDKITTDITDATVGAKGDLIRAYSEFTTSVEEYPGSESDGLFTPSIMEAAKKFLGMRLPADPSKNS